MTRLAQELLRRYLRSSSQHTSTIPTQNHLYGPANTWGSNPSCSTPRGIWAPGIMKSLGKSTDTQILTMAKDKIKQTKKKIKPNGDISHRKERVGTGQPLSYRNFPFCLILEEFWF